MLAVGQPPARQAGRLQIHSTTDPCLRGFGALIGPARIWAAIAGFKVESANRYTTGPAVSASNSNSVLQTSWRQKDVQSRWWKQGRDDLGTFFGQMKTLFFKKKNLNHPAPAFAILPRPPAPLQTVLAVGQPPARQAGRLQSHSTTDPCLRGFGALIGPARIWAAIAGFKVESANRYTTGPAVSASNSNSVLQTSWRQKDVQSRWWKQGRDDLGTFFGQMKTLFFKKKNLNHPAPAFAILPRPPAPLQTVLAVGQPPARQAGRLQSHSTTDPCLRGFGALIGPARIWAAIARFRVQSANRYTTGPAVSASNSNSVLQTSWRQKDVQSRWWKQGRDDLGTFSCQMKTLFFY